MKCLDMTLLSHTSEVNLTEVNSYIKRDNAFLA